MMTAGIDDERRYRDEQDQERPGATRQLTGIDKRRRAACNTSAAASNAAPTSIGT
jgi:hypothetical protein